MKLNRIGMNGILLGVVSLLISVTVAPSHADDVRGGIEATNRQFEAAVARGDSAALAALYTGNGQLLPAQSDVVTGTAAIAAFWQAAFDSGVKSATLATDEVEGHDDTAHEVGKYEMRDGDGRTLDRGKYIVIWKKEGSAWKLHRDIWNTSQPPPVP